MKDELSENSYYKLSKYVIITPLFNNNKNVLYYSTRTSNTILLNAEIHTKILKHNWLKINNKLLDMLINEKIVVRQNENELDDVLNNFKANIDKRKILSFTIQPSANCQLGCTYCGQTHNNYNLNSELNDDIINRFKNKLLSNQYSKVDIGWYGGEPLIGLKQMRILSTKMMKLSEEMGIDYRAKVVTNGLLLSQAIFEKLIKIKVKQIEITIDGTEVYHNSTRPSKNGKGSFRIIFNNLLNAVRYINNNKLTDIEITIRHNINKSNKESVFPFLYLMKNNNLENYIFYYISPVHSWGNDAHTLSLSNEEFSKLQIDVYSKMKELNFFVSWLPKNSKATTCIATTKDGEIIDAYGNIHKCSETPYVDTYSLKLEPVSEQLNKFNSDFEETFDKWYDILNQQIYPCNSCNILPICGGHCPKLWHESIPNCPPIKYNIIDRIIKNYYYSI